MKNQKYKYKENGAIIDALSWSKQGFLKIQEELDKEGVLNINKQLPADEEFIRDGIICLDSDSRYERI